MVAGAASTVGSTVLGAAKGLASCMGTSNAATSNGNTLTNNINIPPSGPSGGGGPSVTAMIGIASAAYFIAVNMYDRYDMKDDHRLLMKLSMEDCGGLSKMLSNVEGCYRQYASKAIHRYISASEYKDLKSRFLECFARRPVHPCSWRGEDVYATGG